MIKLNTKRQARKLFGSYAAIGRSLGITRQAVQKWPNVLTERQKNEILGAAIREGLIA